MATINFSTLNTTFDMLSTGNVNPAAAPTSPNTSTYQWDTVLSGGNFFRYNLTSALGDIVAGSPPSGTISSITVSLSATGVFSTAFTITDLNAPLASLVNTSTLALTAERFWEKVMAGASTIILPDSNSISVSAFGDFYEVESAQTGAADVFQGGIATGGSSGLYGDAFQVLSGGKLTGGNDSFNKAMGAILAGDAYNALDSVTGGNDAFNYNYAFGFGPPITFSTVTGDVFNMTGATPFDAVFIGGKDNFNFNNASSFSTVVGDVYSAVNLKSFLGGDDLFSIKRSGSYTSPTGVSILTGDVVVLQDVSDNVSGTVYDAIGGKDTINLLNVSGSVVEGDFYQVAASGVNVIKVQGGNDVITAASNFVSQTPGSPPPASSSFSVIDGDANLFSASTASALRGGNDVISLTNVLGSSINGDVSSFSTTNGVMTGGNDTITYTWNRSDTNGSIGLLTGDATSASARVFIGGNDTFVLKGTGTISLGSVYLDAASVNTGSTSANFVFGNDSFDVQATLLGGIVVAGDAASVTSSGGSVKGGNDIIKGGNFADSLYGDFISAPTGFTSITGGNDQLDGRGGNDLINGGAGTDTALFNSLAIGVHVDLQGISGSNPATPADPYEAIGQGFDQLISMENVTGSSANDTILGNGGANILLGGGGVDRLSGRGGADRLAGGVGIDFLNGGAGGDRFEFTALNEFGDHLVSFDSADVIAIKGSVIGVTSATLAASFVSRASDTNAQDANDRLIYNQATDELWFDSNGSAAGGTKVLVANLDVNFNLTASDIAII